MQFFRLLINKVLEFIHRIREFFFGNSDNYVDIFYHKNSRRKQQQTREIKIHQDIGRSASCSIEEIVQEDVQKNFSALQEEVCVLVDVVEQDDKSIDSDKSEASKDSVNTELQELIKNEKKFEEGELVSDKVILLRQSEVKKVETMMRTQEKFLLNLTQEKGKNTPDDIIATTEDISDCAMHEDSEESRFKRVVTLLLKPVIEHEDSMGLLNEMLVRVLQDKSKTEGEIMCAGFGMLLGYVIHTVAKHPVVGQRIHNTIYDLLVQVGSAQVLAELEQEDRHNSVQTIREEETDDKRIIEVTLSEKRESVQQGYCDLQYRIDYLFFTLHRNIKKSSDVKQDLAEENIGTVLDDSNTENAEHIKIQSDRY
ncbi:MAG: hypothetical protein P857_33 [Candidatus Xenolissoclinum pacificiensis L6]|uniref:Uncharacterized protein n=1 Tax=Candidatus Xenolissoclinum pacificiensis L6 TaxID=1401685 RepID=W2UZJ8_9RICK|nr:MAG: hypothetical protein P857_33 [Candidatus Xenolissoclinum pacificiensis L6]